MNAQNGKDDAKGCFSLVLPRVTSCLVLIN